MHRRNALKLFSLAALSAVAPIGKLGFLDDHVFESTPFGIRLTTPDSWHCLLAPDYLKLLDSDYGDKNPKLPILACTRFPEPTDFENDTLLIFADRMQTPDAPPSGLPKTYRPLDVSDADFEHYSVSATTTDSRDLSFSRDAYFFHDRHSKFHVEFECDASNSTRSAKEFKQILASIELAYPVSPGWG